MFETLSIDPTYECSLNCLSCRCNMLKKYYPKSSFVPFDRYKKLLFEFKTMGGSNVMFFGGEPLLYDKIFELIEYANNLNLYTSISTNGISLSNPIIRNKLSTSSPDEIIISIMGIEEEYTRLHGKPLYNQLLEGLHEYLDECSIKSNIRIHVTVQRKNISSLHKIVYLAKSLGIQTVSYQYVSIVKSNMNKNSEHVLNATFKNEVCHWDVDETLLVKREQLFLLKRAIENVKIASCKTNVKVLIDPVLDEKWDDNAIFNGIYTPSGICLLKDIIVAPNGDISPCPMLHQYSIGNILHTSLRELYKQNTAFSSICRLVQKGTFLPICSSCCKHEMFYN